MDFKVWPVEIAELERFAPVLKCCLILYGRIIKKMKEILMTILNTDVFCLEH